MKIYEHITEFIVVNDKYKFRMPIGYICLNDNWFNYDDLANDRPTRNHHIKNMFEEVCTEGLYSHVAAHLFCGLRSIERIVDEYL